MQAHTESSYRRIEESEVSTRNLIVDSFMQVASKIANPQNSHRFNEARVFSGNNIPTNSPTVLSIINEVSNQEVLTIQFVQHKIDRNLVKVTNVWRKYVVGFSGGPAIKDLKDTYGTRWRKDRTESKIFNTRSVLYKEVYKICEIDSISAEEAAKKLERRRIQLRISIDKLIKLIKASND